MASWTNKGTYYEWVGDEQSVYTLGNVYRDLDSTLFSSTLRNYIPAYTELSKVEAGLYWKTSVGTWEGDGYLYVGDNCVGGEWNTGKNYRDDWAPANLVQYFQSGTANAGIPSPSVRARFEASWGRTSYYTFKLRWYPVWTCNFYSDSTLLKTVKVNMGSTLSDPGLVPTKAADNRYTYQFSKWDKAFGTPTTNTDYYALFTATLRKYTVSALGVNGTVEGVTGDGTYEYGSTITLTATPNESHYAFKQWSDGNTDNPRTITVTGDATYTAIFEPITYYTVFDLNGGTLSWDNSPIAHPYESLTNLGSYGFYGEDVTATYDTQGGRLNIGAETMPRPLVGWEDLGSIKIGDTTYTSDTFDAPYYANKYPNLYAAYGYDKYALALHYHTTGKDRGEQCINTEGDKARGLYPNGAQVSHLTNINGHIVPLKCRWGEVTVTLGTPTKKGYEFLGWTDGENTYQAGETVSLIKSTTFTAQWKPNNIFVGNTPAQGVYVGDKPAKAIYKGTTLIYEK